MKEGRKERRNKGEREEISHVDRTRLFWLGISEQITIRHCFLRIESEEIKSGDHGHLGRIWPRDRATLIHPGPMCLHYPGSPQAKARGVTPLSHVSQAFPVHSWF